MLSQICGITQVEGTLLALQSNLLLKAGSVQNSEQISHGFVHLSLEKLYKLESGQLWRSKA